MINPYVITCLACELSSICMHASKQIRKENKEERSKLLHQSRRVPTELNYKVLIKTPDQNLVKELNTR